MRLAFICLLSGIAATAAGVGGLVISYSLFMNQTVSGEDLAGIATFCFVPTLLMSLLLYMPGLIWLGKNEATASRRFYL